MRPHSPHGRRLRQVPGRLVASRALVAGLYQEFLLLVFLHSRLVSQNSRRAPASALLFIMSVPLTEIRTLRALYKAKFLNPAEAAAVRYKSSGSLLDKVSL